MYCPKCGYEVTNDWKACPNCGAMLSTVDRVQQSNVLGDTVNKGPSPWLYGVGIALIIIPFILAMVLLFVDLFEHNPDTRVVVPGTHELNFDDTGKYTIFYEYQSSVDGKGYSTGEYLKGVVVSLHSKDSTQYVPLSTTSGNMTYQIGSRAGKSLFDFEIDEPGIYVLHAEYQDGTSSPEVVFAIGPQFDILRNILTSIGIGVGGFVLGGLLILWVFIKRRRASEKTGHSAIDPNVSPRSRLVVTLLALFVGNLGIHRFYLEKYITGVLMLITLGGLGFWALIDLIVAICGAMKDKDGKPIKNWD